MTTLDETRLALLDRTLMSTMSVQYQKKQLKYSKKPQNIAKDSPPAPSRYMEVFQMYREELDAKHDKHERIVKLSRDCTIHSKRTIFLLHRTTSDPKKSEILSEADGKFKEILAILKLITCELVGEDPDKYRSAYSPGIQEFIEALTYFMFLKSGKLISVEETQKYLTFHEETENCMADSEGEEMNKTQEMEGGDQLPVATSVSHLITLPLNSLDYVLGVADLTGELMRMSINAVGSGNQDLPFGILPFVRAVHCGFQSLRPISREIPRKLYVLRSSLAKIEQVCYTLKIRGSEIPKHMLVHALNVSTRAENAQNSETEVYDNGM